MSAEFPAAICAAARSTATRSRPPRSRERTTCTMVNGVRMVKISLSGLAAGEGRGSRDQPVEAGGKNAAEGRRDMLLEMKNAPAVGRAQNAGETQQHGVHGGAQKDGRGQRGRRGAARDGGVNDESHQRGD